MSKKSGRNGIGFKNSRHLIDMEARVLWVTAYKHLGREKWHSARSFEEYLTCFERIRHLDPVCFIDEPHASAVKVSRILPYDEQDTFFPKYLLRQREILESDDFLMPIPKTSWAAFESAEYSIVNFSKTCLLRRASELFPGYTHYAWIDFGYAKKPGDAVPEHFECTRLIDHDKILIAACRDVFLDDSGVPMYGAWGSTNPQDATVYNWNNPHRVHKDFHYLLQCNLYIVPKNLTHWLEREMERSIQRHHDLGIANHDEPFFLPIIHDFRNRFRIYIKTLWTADWGWFTDRGSFRIQKKDGRLIYKTSGGDGRRNESMLWCIRQADQRYNWPDFDPLTIYTNDFRTVPGSYSISGHDMLDRLVPDFTFYDWKGVLNRDYDDIITAISSAGQEPFTVNKVGWIGTMSHQYRQVLMDIAAGNPDMFECTLMNWGPDYDTPNKFVSLEELVRTYSILIDVEGYGYSARVKYLLWARRPLLLVDREHKEFYYQWLVPWLHYIPVRRDMSDLVEKTRWCLDHYDHAMCIAQRAYEFSTVHLTRDACYKRWDEIISTAKSLA